VRTADGIPVPLLSAIRYYIFQLLVVEQNVGGRACVKIMIELDKFLPDI